MITININKARTVAHDMRRTARAAEFAPLDIKATIPSEAAAAESARQEIRARYAAIQADIDTAPGVAELKLVVDGL